MMLVGLYWPWGLKEHACLQRRLSFLKACLATLTSMVETILSFLEARLSCGGRSGEDDCSSLTILPQDACEFSQVVMESSLSDSDISTVVLINGMYGWTVDF